MSDHTFWETIEAKGGAVLDTLKQIVEAGNVRRIRVRQQQRVIAEFPLTIGVVGAVFAPMLAAIGAIAALATECSIEVERTTPASASTETPAPAPDITP